MSRIRKIISKWGPKGGQKRAKKVQKGKITQKGAKKRGQKCYQSTLNGGPERSFESDVLTIWRRPKKGQKGPKRGQKGSKRGQKGVKRGQKGSKTRGTGLKSKRGQFHGYLGYIFIKIGSKTPKVTKRGQKGSKRGQKGVKRAKGAIILSDLRTLPSAIIRCFKRG